MHTSQNMQRTLRAALFAVPFLLAAACGSDDGDAPADPGSAGTGGSSANAGAGGSTDGGAGGAGAPSLGPLWIIRGETKKVAVIDSDGTELFGETLASTPLALALDGGNAWVIAEDGSILRYDVATQTKKATIAGATHPKRLAAAGGVAWVVDEDGTTCTNTAGEGPTKLLRVDPATDTVTATTPLNLDEAAGACDPVGGLSANAQGAFVILDNGFGAISVAAATGAISQRAKLGLDAGYGVGTGAVSTTSLWVYDRSRHSLLDLDPATLTERSTTTLPDDVLGNVMTASDKAVWIQSSNGMMRIDATATDKRLSLALESSPIAVARSTKGLYTSNGDEVVVLDSVTGEKKGEIPLVFADDLAVP
jgi:hypothetical protein